MILTGGNREEARLRRIRCRLRWAPRSRTVHLVPARSAPVSLGPPGWSTWRSTWLAPSSIAGLPIPISTTHAEQPSAGPHAVIPELARSMALRVPLLIDEPEHGSLPDQFSPRLWPEPDVRGDLVTGRVGRRRPWPVSATLLAELREDDASRFTPGLDLVQRGHRLPVVVSPHGQHRRRGFSHGWETGLVPS
jgi:hypothetical protein